MRSLLGLTGYYRKFISNYAEKVKSLTDLTQKHYPDKIKWEEEQQNAFEQLKSELSKQPVFKLPELDKQFVLQTDASDIGLGAVLLQ